MVNVTSSLVFSCVAAGLQHCNSHSGQISVSTPCKDFCNSHKFIFILLEVILSRSCFILSLSSRNNSFATKPPSLQASHCHAVKRTIQMISYLGIRRANSKVP